MNDRDEIIDWPIRNVKVGDKVSEQRSEPDYWGNTAPMGVVKRTTRCFFWTSDAKYRRSDGKRIGQFGRAWLWTRHDDRRVECEAANAELRRSLRSLLTHADRGTLFEHREIRRLEKAIDKIMDRLGHP